MKSRFNVILLEPVREFLKELDKKARNKVLFNIDKTKVLNDPELFKKLTEHIWEFRTKYKNIQIRLFAFWDKRDNKNTLVISTSGFIKKTSKVPQKEINRAISIMKKYFEEN